MAVSVTRVVNGHLETILLDFIKLTERHTGAYMAGKIFEMLEFYGILDRVSHLVLMFSILHV